MLGRKFSQKMIRWSITIPEDEMNALRDEAIKRLKAQNNFGEKTWRAYARDIACICIDRYLQEIRAMDDKEYKDAVKKAMS